MTEPYERAASALEAELGPFLTSQREDVIAILRREFPAPAQPAKQPATP